MKGEIGTQIEGGKEQASRKAGEYPINLHALMLLAVERKASDLHLTPGKPPVLRIYGELTPLKYPQLTPDNVQELLSGVMQHEHWERLREQKELDFFYSIPGIHRFRGNIMYQRGSLAVAFRLVPFDPPNIDDLGLPPSVRDLCFLPRGLVLITGPTGAGKTTTLASMINVINNERSVNIVTIEDPIEYLHKHNKSIIKQREVGSDTTSMAEALRNVLRHDPDVILLGEMRDLESISIALTAAETGHLVLSTLHTQNAPMTINRIIDVFHDQMRHQIRHQVANSIQGIVAQQLLSRYDGNGRAVATEVMIATSAVRNLIREGKEHQIYSVMQTSRRDGMQTMDQSLVDLLWRGLITKEMAMQRCIDPTEIERLLEVKEISGFIESSGKTHSAARRSASAKASE